MKNSDPDSLPDPRTDEAADGSATAEPAVAAADEDSTAAARGTTDTRTTQEQGTAPNPQAAHDRTSKESAEVAEGDTPTTTFADLGLDDAVLKGLKAVGYETPSAIQAATIPPLLSGRDVVGLAQTGTGKTAAFALPILSRIDLDRRLPQALVLAPTRELALQVCEAIESYSSALPDLHVLPVYGGQGYGMQLSALRRGVHIVVGTPGRILDHLDRGTLDLGELRYLVLDEADEMLQMGFAEDVETILGATPAEKQVALFSATMPKQIRRISQQYLRDPAEISIQGATTTASNIRQRYLVVAYSQKLDALTRILEVEDFEALLVFVRTKNDTEKVAEKLRARGYSAQALNGDVPQAQRERTVSQLRDGALDILVATDVAARGLDVERISHVVNFDIPTDTESYVHRIGRTGRAGRAGDAISFITPRERWLLRHIEKATRQPLEQMRLPSVDEVNSTRLSRFDDAITQALENTERLATFRDIIGHYVRHHDIPETDVAAALAIVAQGDTPLLLDPDDELRRPDERSRRDDRGRDGGRGGDRRRSSKPMRTYRIGVGRRNHVEPGQVVGALTNEGGIAAADIGAISIRGDFSLVELAADLDRGRIDGLRDIRIGGRPIDLREDHGGPGAGRGSRRGRDGGEHRPRRDGDYDGRGARGRFRDDRRRGPGRRDDHGGHGQRGDRS